MSVLESVKVRDGLEILWSSLATIITCTYTILHLNVPRQRQGRDPGWKGDIKWSPFWRSLGWCIFTALAPECILAISISDLIASRKLLRRLHKAKPETEKTWQLTHMLFACMGGFAIEVRSSDATAPADDPNSVPGHVDRQKQVDLEGQSQREREPERPTLYHLPVDTVVYAIEKGLIPPSVVSADEIMDRSKSTLFTKLLTLGQTLYFIIQFIVRWRKGLPVTPLEVGVVGFVVCAVFTYGCVLFKPKDVALVIILASFQNTAPEAILTSARHERQRAGGRIRDITDPVSTTSNLYYFDQLPYALGVVLGAIHLTAWNLDYPTVVDVWLWRAASLYITMAGLGCLGLFFINDWASGWILGPMWVIILLYATARVILLVEMFRSLFYLPLSAFASTWTENVPHIG